MPIIATAKGSDNFEPVPAGVHNAICAFVEDVGMEYSELYDKEHHKVVVCWEINVPMSDGRPYMISKSYTVSLSDKSNLRKDLEGWRGKKFTDEELKGFDLEVLRGKQCQLHIMHNDKNGRTYANIQSVLPASKDVKLSIVNQEPPAWIAERRENNAKRLAALDNSPVVIVDDAPKKTQKPAVALIDDDAIPF